MDGDRVYFRWPGYVTRRHISVVSRVSEAAELSHLDSGLRRYEGRLSNVEARPVSGSDASARRGAGLAPSGPRLHP